jgi:hypothetical protein
MQYPTAYTRPTRRYDIRLAGLFGLAIAMSASASPGLAREPTGPPPATAQETATPATPAAPGVAPQEAAPPAAAAASPAPAPGMTMDMFLDRLMRAESGGVLTARNSRSTALGPFQFIEATFLDVARRHFGEETAALAPAQVLALRTDLDFSRRAAEAYTRDNAASLAAAGLPATFPNLRLAFLLGPGGAIRLLQADPSVPVAKILPVSVLIANPFMNTLTAEGLAARAARDISMPAAALAAGIAVKSVKLGWVPPVARTAPPVPRAGGGTVKVAAAAAPAPPSVVVRCDLGLASCRKWLALEQRRLGGRNAKVRVATAR